jgi:protein TonB
MDAIDRVAGLVEYSPVKMHSLLAVAIIAASSCAVLAQSPQPSPSASKSPKLRVAQAVAEGKIIKKVPPRYPIEAKRKHITGVVILDFTIDKSGNVEDLKMVSGDPILTQAAVEAVRQWKYTPYLLNGDPVEVETTVKITFRM